MKRLLIGGLLLMAVVGVQAQNVQLHYDLGRNIYPDEEAGRPKVTMTLEQFKLDSWGSWFYFVDVDFSRKFTESAYTEISRELNLYKGSKFAAHVEYNGGLSKSGSFQQAALVGMAYNGWNPALSASYSLQLMYKRYFKSYDYTFTNQAWERYSKIMAQAYQMRDPETWGNARFVANQLERIYIQHATRCVKHQPKDKGELLLITPEDILPIEIPRQKTKIGF